MSKNNGFGKFVLFCTAVGAAAAGAYYYLSKRDAAIADGFDDDDFDDFDDFEDDDDDSSEIKLGSRKYVDIKSSDDDKSTGSEDASEESADDDKTDDTAGDEVAEDTKSEEFFDDEE